MKLLFIIALLGYSVEFLTYETIPNLYEEEYFHELNRCNRVIPKGQRCFVEVKAIWVPEHKG